MKATPDTKILKKRPQVPRLIPSACLDCGSEAGYREQEVTREVEFRGEDFSVSYACFVCPDCGSATLSDEQMAARMRRTVEAYQERHGLLKGSEVATRRKALGYATQSALVEACPVISGATLKRLEAGTHAQDRSTDVLIRKCFEDLEAKRLNEDIAALLKEYNPSHAIFAEVSQCIAGESKMSFDRFEFQSVIEIEENTIRTRFKTMGGVTPQTEFAYAS